MIRVLLTLIIFFSATVFAKNNVYVLPQDRKDAYDKIVDEIKNAEQRIDIYMYNFSYKILAKHLKDAKKRGVAINLYLDYKKVKKEDKIYKYLKKNGIKSNLFKDKNHLKVAIFDKKRAILGSMNWTKQSFQDNYEMMLFTDESSIVKPLIKKLPGIK